MADKGRILFPGGDPGDYATGFIANSHIRALAAKRLGMDDIPVGNEVAQYFPWLRYVRQTIPYGEQVRVKRTLSRQTFANTTQDPILVYEVRIYLGSQPDIKGRGSPTMEGIVNPHAQGVAPYDWTDLQKSLWIKMSIPDRLNIIEKWLPVHQIITENDHIVEAELDRLAWQLPAPYYLSRSHAFTMDIGRTGALVADAAGEDPFYIVLHGWGAEDGEPIDLVKSVPDILTDDVDYGWETIRFNDDRDESMRDAVITHIGIGAGSQDNQGWALQYAQIRPRAPEGMEWHSEEFFPFAVLARQLPGVYVAQGSSNQCYASIMHRPAVPYILFPGESLDIDLWNRRDLVTSYCDDEDTDDMYADVAVHGLQGVKGLRK